MSKLVLSEELTLLKDKVNLLDQINNICPDINIVNYRNRDYYCSSMMNKEADKVDFLQPEIYFQGTYSVSFYKEFDIDCSKSKIRIYGFPIEILIFDLNLNNLSFYPYHNIFKKLEVSENIIKQVNTYIINFIVSNKLTVNDYLVPNKIKSLLLFT